MPRRPDPPSPLAVEAWPLERITPYARNPRKNDGAVAKVAASLKEFGWRQPIVVDTEGVVIAGHTRLLAARQLGMTEAPVHVATGLTPQQVKAYRLADNRTSEEAEWDTDLLSLEFGDLFADGYDLALTGFDPGEIAALQTGRGAPGADEAPPPPADPVTRPGDLYHLGPHRLLCGDATDAGAWERVLAGRQADLLWTDPPYGVAYVGKTKEALTIKNDTLEPDALREFLGGALALAWAHTRDGGAWYVAAPPGPLHLVFGQVLFDLDVWRQTIAWVKDGFVLGRSDYHYRHESIFYGWKAGAAHFFVDDRTQDTVWEIPRPKASADHPTMKPVELVARAIRNSSTAGQLVVDPFGGSGTTLAAAEQEGRVAALLELDPRYCDVIVRRWETQTGRTAERLTGRV